MADDRAQIHKWGEAKSKRIGLLLTPTAVEMLDELIELLGEPSRAEVLETLIREKHEQVSQPKKSQKLAA